MAKARANGKKKGKKKVVPRRIEPAPEPERGIAGIEVEGFKSIRKRTGIAIKPLTILAGANSSGKSSIMQPLLLMKQTLEAPYDPGALLLDGPHAHFTDLEQLFWRARGRGASRFEILLETSRGEKVALKFERQRRGELRLAQMWERDEVSEGTWHHRQLSKVGDTVFFIERRRCFLGAKMLSPEEIEAKSFTVDEDELINTSKIHALRRDIGSIIHVPALRGNPERTYKRTAVGTDFPGTFDAYVASIVYRWQRTNDIRLKRLGAALDELGLNWKIQASRVDDTRVELRVARIKRKTADGARDMVSIADVGFGVSQCLSVVVALLTAQPGQLVYLEEPEIHLHPRAQVALAQLLADAANRGVRVVVETHSSLLLTGVQTLVAEGALPPESVALHWFSLDDEGATEVRSADLDEAGAFGDWPEDFAEVALEAQARYLDAAEKRLAGGKR